MVTAVTVFKVTIVTGLGNRIANAITTAVAAAVAVTFVRIDGIAVVALLTELHTTIAALLCEAVRTTAIAVVAIGVVALLILVEYAVTTARAA